MFACFSVLNDEKIDNVKQIETVNEKDDMLSSFDVLCQGINKKQRRILQREFERQGNCFDLFIDSKKKTSSKVKAERVEAFFLSKLNV